MNAIDDFRYCSYKTDLELLYYIVVSIACLKGNVNFVINFKNFTRYRTQTDCYA